MTTRISVDRAHFQRILDGRATPQAKPTMDSATARLAVDAIHSALKILDEQQRAANGQFGSGGGGAAAKPAAAPASGGGGGRTPQHQEIVSSVEGKGYKKAESGSPHVEVYKKSDGSSVKTNKYGDWSIHDPSGKKIKSGGATTPGGFAKAFAGLG